MEIGVDSFATGVHGNDTSSAASRARHMAQLLERIAFADKAGLDVFGIGEHHRREFLDAAPHNILSAAATITSRIKLTSAVTVLSAADPVRVFQNFATLDIISNGRAEIVVGRGSSVEAFPLFGYNLNDYDELFAEKLELLLQISENETVSWKGKYRPTMVNQPIYPRPLQEKLPIWLGVGGTPQSFIRAGMLGLPLMVAVIGGETHRFRPLVDLYRQAGAQAGYKPEELKVGLHSFGYVAETTQKAIDEYYPGHAVYMTKIGKERGWPPMTRSRFEASINPLGFNMLGSPEEVAAKILRHSQALGGIDRVTFQMDTADLTHEQLLSSMELMGGKVSELVNKGGAL